jgi:hypothetical protein
VRGCVRDVWWCARSAVLARARAGLDAPPIVPAANVDATREEAVEGGFTYCEYVV